MRLDLYPEEKILEGCKKKDRHFQEVLYRKYASKMYGICMGYAGERPLAQDMLQEAFVKVFRHINDYSRLGSLEGWIRRIVTNTAIDILRKKQKTDLFIENEVTEQGPTPNKWTAPNYMEAGDILKQIKKLPEGARIVFNLYAVEGYTHKEIAEKLHITTGTSKSQYSRARMLLQQWVDKPN